MRIPALFCLGLALSGCATSQAPTCAVDNIELRSANTFIGTTGGRRISVFAADERCWDALDKAIELHREGKL